ncbi:hypothetical protein [Alkaliphilus sp. B6464]|uniref:hypothetical protein n=1 Tax=Alkaliphilus sp. B6464 TaxID=2731219 RepID=UPI001BA4D0E4|nr:hypothetical protein [Alkaliphilus sp. B6464]QUH22088.1 hypothetical protein HYG84_19470 [Alkaliphilus sp. B6464]
MKKYIYAVKILLNILKNIINSEIDDGNYIETINEIIGVQGLSLLVINQIGPSCFSGFCDDYVNKIEKKKNYSLKFEMIELLYNRMILVENFAN